MTTLQERLATVRYRPTGFDYARVLLACAVIVWHAFGVSYGERWADGVENTPLRPLIASILPMFFGLSGFLVASSLERTPGLLTFIGHRVIRIFPALTVECLLSAWILGPLLTSVPLAVYFTSRKFFAYHMNMIGDVHFFLPGMFEHNPIERSVNSQLTTVPLELWCYVILTVIFVVRLFNNRRAFLALLTLATAANLALHLPHVLTYGPDHSNIGTFNLVFAFLWSVCLYKFKDRIPFSGWLAVASAAAIYALLTIPGGDYVSGLPIAYLIVYLGLLNPVKIWLLKGADYSYGMYLYGFAIQQVIAQYVWARHWYINMPIALVSAALFAAFSWHVVEKPALRLKTFLPALERFAARCRAFISYFVRHFWAHLSGQKPRWGNDRQPPLAW
jgi:peptidoglycan/LPS O-acetylase OafA/YrhL